MKSPKKAYTNQEVRSGNEALKQVKLRRDYGLAQKESLVQPTTVKKKDAVASPYDLEYANNYLRNAFKMEVIMSLKEQRKQRPAKYKIKNIKRPGRHASKQRGGSYYPEGHQEVDLNSRKSQDGKIYIREHDRDSSQENRLDDSLHSGRSVEKNGYPVHSRIDNEAPHGGVMILSTQPKHMINPLKYSKPFDLKITKNIDREWLPHKNKDYKVGKYNKGKSKPKNERDMHSRENSLIYRSDEDGPVQPNAVKGSRLVQKRMNGEDQAPKVF